MENPNYYAILSAEVRYDNRLRPNVKLLYAEITALCNMNMECFASNKIVKDNNTSINNTSININISNRRESFILEIMSFDYDKNILNGFIDYWTEPTQSKTNPKMKWELCKTWSTNLRLKNWIANEKKWKPIKINKNKLTKNIDTMKNVLNKLNGHD